MRRGALLLAAAALGASACAARQPYTRPVAAQPPPAFKENADWATAQPGDEAVRGAWWQIFADSRLDTLEMQIDVSNETLKAQQARFVEARAAIGINRSALAPQVTVNPTVARTQPSGNRPTTTSGTGYGDFVLPADVSYEVDVWGRIRSSIEGSRATAQASAADLETIRLSLHAELAVDYFDLRAVDAEQALLASTVSAYERALELTRNRFAGGIASQADVALAETQLETTRAQAIDLGIDHASLEHAVAVLVGKVPSSFSMAQTPLATTVPSIPVGLPATLLERRPDVAGAERRVAAANAAVGVARSAYFPRLLLTGSAGFESGSFLKLLTGLSSFWTAGPALAATIADGGRRRAVTAQALAALDESAALYRQSVLVAFQDVEDQLATLRVLDQEARTLAAAVDAAERSLALANNRYRGGVASYLEVITAQSAALANERAAVGLQSRRLASSVLLIKALGGGWDPSSLAAAGAGKGDLHK